MCLYIVDNVSTCRIIYFQYVDTEKRIDNSPTLYNFNLAVISMKLLCMTRGQNKPKISRAIWSNGTTKWRALNFFSRARFGFTNVFYTSGFEMSQHFQGPFGPLVLIFCGPSINFEGNWPKGPPYFNPYRGFSCDVIAAKSAKSRCSQRPCWTSQNMA